MVRARPDQVVGVVALARGHRFDVRPFPVRDVLAKGALVVGFDEDFLFDADGQCRARLLGRNRPRFVQELVEILQVIHIVEVFAALLGKRQLAFGTMLRSVGRKPAKQPRRHLHADRRFDFGKTLAHINLVPLPGGSL